MIIALLICLLLVKLPHNMLCILQDYCKMHTHRHTHIWWRPKETETDGHTAWHGKQRPGSPLKTSLWPVTKTTGADRLPYATETTQTVCVNIHECVSRCFFFGCCSHEHSSLWANARHCNCVQVSSYAQCLHLQTEDDYIFHQHLGIWKLMVCVCMSAFMWLCICLSTHISSAQQVPCSSTLQPLVKLNVLQTPWEI